MMRRKLEATLLIAVLAAIVLGPVAAPTAAQTAELPRHTEAISWSSGNHNGHGGGPARLAASDILSVPGVPWMQLVLGPGKLGKKSRIEITSLLDGGTQVLDAEAMKQWNGRSAYFNGDEVEVRLYVGANAKAVSARVSEVVVGDWVFGTKSLCGADDRVASSESRVGRIDPIGCTGWTIDNGKLLTAGHCLAGSGNTTLSFNVPPSLPDTTVQFPGPEDQYSINQGSFDYTNGGVGNDWGVFAVYNNSQTGLQPHAAQGAFSFTQDLGPTNIRITGFGVDSGTTNQTNQTDVGPNAGSSGTTMRYVTDTMGGNSGSPVIDEATGVAVGIHTHGGCSTGNNNGTSFFNTAAWTAINGGSSGGGTLTNGVPETGLSASTGGELRYTLEVPAGATNLSFVTTGSDPDADLYVKFGSAPTTSSYDCRSWTSSSNETCDIGTAQTGTYHVLVYAYSSFSGLSLTGSYTSGGGCTPYSDSTSNISGSYHTWYRDSVTVPSCATSLTVEISGGSGDADLYVRFGSEPTTSSWNCRPYKWGNNEICTFTPPSAGTYHIGLYAYDAYSGVTLDVDYN